MAHHPAQAAGLRAAFQGFEPRVVAAFGERERQRLLADAGIVRNRAKIDATIGNATVAARACRRTRHISRLPRHAGAAAAATPSWAYSQAGSIPATTPASDALSRELRRCGFRFVGSTIVYSFMQSVGLVDDHLPECFLYGMM